MQFGSFVFPVSHHPENDSVVIDNTLAEISLAEEIGMHSVWLTEHHFDGALPTPTRWCWAQPSRPAPAASRSDLPWWSWPFTIRCACSADALLDNLSHGRLIVGTGGGLCLQPLRIHRLWADHGRGYRPAGRGGAAAGGSMDCRRSLPSWGALERRLPRTAAPTLQKPHRRSSEPVSARHQRSTWQKSDARS